VHTGRIVRNSWISVSTTGAQIPKEPTYTRRESMLRKEPLTHPRSKMAAETVSRTVRHSMETFFIMDSFDFMRNLLHFTCPVYRIILNIEIS
jgi:hypothetical protein